MISPFICYTLSFFVVMLVYLLGWSELYPKLSWSLIFFLVGTLVVHIVCHWITVRKNFISFRKLETEKLPLVGTTIFIYILWVVEFIYEGGIPLVKILLQQPYNYRMFGVPSLHVFVVTFSSFFTVYLFHLWRSNKSKLVLILYIVNLSAALLIYSRAMLYFNITASIIVYLLSLKRIPYSRMGLIVIIIVPLFYLFGVLGSLRISREAHQSYNNENFMDTGKASTSFRQSFIPKEYFWTYIYVSSSLANLQYNIERNPNPKFTPSRLFWAGVYECFPDFITKRIHALRGTGPPKEYRIAFSFNVSTIYSRSYSYSRWPGIILIAVFIILLPWLFLKILDRQSDFFITGWAILCTMYFFMSYDNTIRFTGLSFQLVYPLLFGYWEKYFYRKK